MRGLDWLLLVLFIFTWVWIWNVNTDLLKRWLLITKWIFIHGPLIPGSSTKEAYEAYRKIWEGEDHVARP